VLLRVDGFQDVVGALDVATRRWVFSRHTYKLSFFCYYPCSLLVRGILVR
jgi:hypothetical protein